MSAVPIPEPCRRAIAGLAARGGRLVVLTGAGVSADSGVPTFRGPDGYWTVGSRNYQPEQLATLAAFTRMPREIWGWYLWRRGICACAEPNAAHRALVTATQTLGARMTLITQNVDGLHARAGHPAERLYAIHGDLGRMRCAAGCDRMLPVPNELPLDWPRGRLPDDAEWGRLRCDCGAPMRPHVLWFDECYDERWFRYDSSLAAARAADMLWIAGTSGATNLPQQIAANALQRRIPVVVANLEPSPFDGAGWVLRGRAEEVVPELVGALG